MPRLPHPSRGILPPTVNRCTSIVNPHPGLRRNDEMRTAVFQSDRSRSVGGLPDAATLLDRFAHLDVLDRIDGRRQRVLVEDDEIGEQRSEEHTSELQSLIRNSY